jgi:hypothetical protein
MRPKRMVCRIDFLEARSIHPHRLKRPLYASVCSAVEAIASLSGSYLNMEQRVETGIEIFEPVALSLEQIAQEAATEERTAALLSG